MGAEEEGEGETLALVFRLGSDGGCSILVVIFCA